MNIPELTDPQEAWLNFADNYRSASSDMKDLIGQLMTPDQKKRLLGALGEQQDLTKPKSQALTSGPPLPSLVNVVNQPEIATCHSCGSMTEVRHQGTSLAWQLLSLLIVVIGLITMLTIIFFIFGIFFTLIGVIMLGKSGKNYRVCMNPNCGCMFETAYHPSQSVSSNTMPQSHIPDCPRCPYDAEIIVKSKGNLYLSVGLIMAFGPLFIGIATDSLFIMCSSFFGMTLLIYSKVRLVTCPVCDKSESRSQMVPFYVSNGYTRIVQ